jgi:hypothetical protein
LTAAICLSQLTTAAASAPAPVLHGHAHHLDKVVRAGHQPKVKGKHKLTDPARVAAPSSGSTTGAAGTVAPLDQTGGTWQFAGPQPIAGDYGSASGRVTSLAVDPTSSAIVYAGTAGGGVWKTSDSGTTWTPLTDNQATLSIGAVAVDPNNHLTVFAGTGEANRSIDSQAGEGVLKSTDGGATWTFYGGSQFAGHHIYAVAVDRTNSSHVLVASSVGLFSSTDGGQTYTFNSSLFGLSPNTANYDPRVDALVQDPDAAHSSRWYAAVDERCLESGFIGVSTDGGATWSQSIRASSLSGLPKIARIGMGEGQGGVIYATLAACEDTSLKFQDGQLAGLLKSTNYGTTWVNTPMPDPFTVSSESQGWYDITIGVDPTNSNRAVFGGITMLSTSDGGLTFTDIARPYSGGPVHPDFHAIAFTGAKSFYTGNDGGVWRTFDLGGTGTASDWTNLSATLAVTTFYGGDASDSTHMIGGAQDEGTSGLVPGGPASPAWNQLAGGDGGYVSMVPGTTTYYGEQSYGAIFKADYTNPGSATAAGPCAAASDPACPEASAFVAPFVIDPANPSIMFTAGTHLYRSTSGGLPAGSGGWSQISGDLSTGTTYFADGDYVSAMGISSDGSELVLGTAGGKLWFVSSPSASPTLTDLTSSIPAFSAADYTGNPWVSAISGVICQSGSCRATVALGAVGVSRVISVSTTSPATDLDRNLGTLIPNVVVNSVLVTDDGTYIGSDSGVYACFALCGSTSPSWLAIGTGLPNAKVDQVTLSGDRKDVIAWTHGRGAWVLPRVAASSLSATSIDFSGVTVGETNQQFVWFRNSGLSTTEFTSIALSGPNAADFSLAEANCRFNPVVGGPPPITMSPGASCELLVTFVASTTSGESATVTLSNSATPSLTVALTGSAQSPAAAVTPTILTYATTSVATSTDATVSISNSGPGYLDVKSYQFTGADPGDFFYSGDTCLKARVAPGTTCTVNVSFKPISSGTRTAIFAITDNAPDSPQTVSLSGDGSQPSVMVSPSSVDFGSQNDGTATTQTVVVTNNGPGLFVLTGLPGYGVTITGANANDFALTQAPCPPAQVAPGSQCAINVEFAPRYGEVGVRTATLNLIDNATSSPQQVALTGTAVGAVETVSPTSIDFGNVLWNQTGSHAVTVTNTGTADLVLGTASASTSFAVPHGTDFCSGKTLVPGTSCTLTVIFQPVGASIPPQPANGWLGIPPYANVQLRGTAIGPLLTLNPPPPPVASSWWLVLPNAAVGGSSTMTVTVQNWDKLSDGSTVPGSADLHVTAFSITGPAASDFSIVGQNCIGVAVAPSSSCTVTLKFKPTTTGLRDATLNIADDAYCCDSKADVSGTGIASSPCTSATIGTSPASPGAQGATVTVSGTAATCGKPLYRFWLRPPGRAWTIVQNYSTSSTFSWNTSLSSGGAYALEVDVRDQSSSASYDAVATTSYSLAVCSSLGLSTSSQPPQVAGTTITLTANASCPGTAEYRFWISESGVWTKVQDYSSANTYSWNTTGKPAGTYGLEVDVRDHGSALAYDVVKNSSFALTTATCGVPSFSASPASQAGTGATVTLSASTTGCPHPQYRFWIAPPGGSWSVVQNYGTLSTYTWTSTGSAGSYRLEVDVRDASSTASYEHYASMTYSLVACTGAQLTTDLQSPQQAGATVKLTASATCLGKPQYRFWVRDTTGKWSIVEDYGTSNTFSWNTTNLPPGTYGLEVDVRDQGASASYEAVKNITFQVS